MANADTRDKRASCLMVALPFGRIWPNPDGVLDQGDRQQSSYLYRGISALGTTIMAFERAIMRRVHSRIFGRVNRCEQAPSWAERRR